MKDSFYQLVNGIAIGSSLTFIYFKHEASPYFILAIGLALLSFIGLNTKK